MSQANVKSVQALEILKNNISLFRNETGQILERINQEIAQTFEWINERKRYWQYQVERCEDMVRQARNALERCLADRDRRCGHYEEQLSAAYRYLRETQQELQNVIQWKKRVEQAVENYRRQAYRLNSQLNLDLPKGESFLGMTISKLYEYISTAIPSESNFDNENIISQKSQNINVSRIPHGFKTSSEFNDFAHMLYSGFEEAGYDDITAIMQGSAVTDKSFRKHFGKHLPFRDSSDFDVAIVSPLLFNVAKMSGAKVRGKKNQPRILLNKKIHYIIESLGLANVRKQLYKKTGRHVDFMIYKSKSDDLERGQTAAEKIGLPKEQGNIKLPK